MRMRGAGAVLGALVIGVGLLAGCSTGGATGTAKPAPAPVAQVSYQPGDHATGVNPKARVSVQVAGGTLQDVALTSPSGKAVAGTLNPARTAFTVGEPLGYGATYRWSGRAVGTDAKTVPVTGGFTTVAPSSTTEAKLNISDDQTVGIAAPIILKFDKHVENKAAVEKALTVTTNPPTVGSWAWLPDDGGSRVHWRPQHYWTPGTTVQVKAPLYGVDYGQGAWGDQDLNLNFAIGRSQIVKADATSHRMQVVRGGETVMDIPVSYGQGNETRNVTRSGIHVVTEKYEDIHMSNPPYYTDAHERWAVRISNNGEFIHANPLTVGNQGATNVTNGCINLSTADAQQYFGTAIYGDPVEVSGTRIDLSAADGDLYDWALDWSAWQAMSALPSPPA